MTWIEASGQRWKLHVFFALMAVTFALLFALFGSFGTGNGTLPIYFGIATAVTAIAAHLWVALSIQCASCQKRIGWLVLSAMGTSRWLVQLWRGEVCPSCGDSGSAASPR